MNSANSKTTSALSGKNSAPTQKRAGRATKAGKGTPAKHEPGEAVPPSPPAPPADTVSGFDPAAVAETHGIGWLGDKDKFSYLNAGEFVEVTERRLMKLLRGKVRAKPQEGEMESEADQLANHCVLQRQVDYVLGFLAGYRAGFHDFQGTRLLVRRSPRFIEPVKGECPFLLRYLQTQLPPDEAGVPQWFIFLAWLKRCVEDVRAGQPRQKQILILAGAKDSGKGRTQEQIITDCLCGRMADPIEYLTGETGFNADMFGASHLMSGDPAVSVKKDERQRFKQKLKQLAVSQWHRYHPKGKDAVLLAPVWATSISINLSPDDLALLPAPTADFADKVIMLKTATAEGLPGPDEAEQEKFRATIRREIPALLFFLLNEFDPLLPHDLRDRRYGVRSYENPAIRAAMQEERSEVQLLAMLDVAQPWLKSDKGFWVGKWTKLQAVLENDSETADELSRWVKHHNFTRNLGRLAEEEKDRVSYARHGNGGVWKIFPPKSPPAPDHPAADDV